MSTLKEQLIRLGALSPDFESKEGPSTFSTKASKPHRSDRSNPRKKGSNRSTRTQVHPRSQRARVQATQSKETRSSESPKQEIKDLFARSRLPLPPSGPKRFYFELKSGEVDYIDVEHKDFQALTSAKISVVEDPKGRLCILDQKALMRLFTLDPNWVPAPA